MALLPSDKYSVRFAALFFAASFLTSLFDLPYYYMLLSFGVKLIGDMNNPSSGECTTGDYLEELQEIEGEYINDLGFCLGFCHSQQHRPPASVPIRLGGLFSSYPVPCWTFIPYVLDDVLVLPLVSIACGVRLGYAIVRHSTRWVRLFRAGLTAPAAHHPSRS